MPTSEEIAEERAYVRKHSEAILRLAVELQEPTHTIGPPGLQFLEVPFLKPTCKNPKSRNA
jgi:hypothetical protein